MDQQAVALLLQLLVDADQRLRRGPLQVRLRGRVERRAQEVVVGRVADVELDRRVERGEVDQVGLAELALLLRRLRGEGLLAQLVDRPQRLDRNVSPSSPSILRRSKTTLAASTFVARPVASRVKISFSPWYRPRSGNAKTFSDSSVSG